MTTKRESKNQPQRKHREQRTTPMARAVEADLHTVHGVVTVRRNAKASVVEPTNPLTYRRLSRALEMQRHRHQLGMYTKRKGGMPMTSEQKHPTIEEMRRSFGLGQIQPIHVSPGARETMGSAEEMWAWYEEELREAYEEYDEE